MAHSYSLIARCGYSLLYLCLFVSVKAQSYNTDSLLHRLDHVILQKESIEKEKKLRICNLRALTTDCKDATVKDQLLAQLFHEYISFNIDSALVVAERRMNNLKSFDSSKSKPSALLDLCEGLKSSGEYLRALELMQHIDRTKLEKEHLRNLYHLYISIYGLFARDANTQKAKIKYEHLLHSYKDSMTYVCDSTQLDYCMNLAGRMELEGKWKKSLELLKRHQSHQLDNAAFDYMLAKAYRHQGKSKAAKYYLIHSAIADLQQCNKKYMSLQQLAIQLYREGDLDRAFKYIMCALDDITSSKAKYRLYEVTEFLPIITTSYHAQMKNQAVWMRGGIVITILFLLILAIAMYFLNKRNRELVRLQLALKNKHEKEQHLNEKLTQANISLQEVNQIKEEYIGLLFDQCSLYIHKLELKNNKVRQFLMSNKKKELLNLVNNPDEIEEELKNFFHEFDAIFLHLYPDFVEAFNTLLQPEFHFNLKDHEMLTPELRIFALVKLGINDSTKIAKLLHYSPRTVYNYRLRMRNRAIVPKTEFSTYVQQL